MLKWSCFSISDPKKFVHPLGFSWLYCLSSARDHVIVPVFRPNSGFWVSDFKMIDIFQNTTCPDPPLTFQTCWVLPLCAGCQIPDRACLLVACLHPSLRRLVGMLLQFFLYGGLKDAIVVRKYSYGLNDKAELYQLSHEKIRNPRWAGATNIYCPYGKSLINRIPLCHRASLFRINSKILIRHVLSLYWSWSLLAAHPPSCCHCTSAVILVHTWTKDWFPILKRFHLKHF